MTGSTASFVTDPIEFAKAVDDACRCTLVTTDTGPFRAGLIRIDLRHLWLFGLEEWSARIMFIRPPPNRVLLLLPLKYPVSQQIAGYSRLPGELITVRAIRGFHWVSAGPCRSVVLCCSESYLHRIGCRTFGSDLILPEGLAYWRPRPESLRSLTTLCAAAIRTTAEKIRLPTDPQAAHGLEQELIGAVTECLAGPPLQHPMRNKQARIDAMARFEDVLLARPQALPSLAELSALVGLKPRTMHNYCQLHLGVGPNRYLRLLLLQRVHWELGGDRPASVTELVQRHGVRQRGRFARSYREYFGELPSETLRRGSGHLTKRTVG